MLLTKKSDVTGIEHSMQLPITENDLRQWQLSGRHIQDYFPELTADQREFILTGITPEEWEEIFPEEDDD